MKYLIFFSALWLFPFQKSNIELFKEFHIVFERSDFNKMNALLTNDFVGLDENSEVSFRKADYVQYMKEWNKTFNTKWNVESVKEVGNLVISIEYDTDIYNDYFYGGKMKYQYTYSFSNGKIKTIKVDLLPGSEKLQAEFKKKFADFYEWVGEKYPDKLMYCISRDRISAIETKNLLEKYLKFDAVDV